MLFHFHTARHHGKAVGKTGYLQGLVAELQYGLGKMVCLGHDLSCGSNQIVASSGDWSTLWEVDVAVEGYFDKDLREMPLTTVQMRTMAVSACVSHWKESKLQAL